MLHQHLLPEHKRKVINLLILLNGALVVVVGSIASGPAVATATAVAGAVACADQVA